MCIYDVSLGVRHDDLVSTIAWEYGSNRETPAEALLSFRREFCPPNTEYIIPAMLARVERDLRQADLNNTSIRVSFDPEFGFVTRYEYRHKIGRGLLGLGMGDCCSEYVFTGFQAREP
jgi:hypothetical protein